MVERYRPKVPETSKAEAALKKIRGRPFLPGNPGRPPGSKNRATLLLEQLMAGDAAQSPVFKTTINVTLAIRRALRRYLGIEPAVPNFEMG